MTHIHFNLFFSTCCWSRSSSFSPYSYIFKYITIYIQTENKNMATWQMMRIVANCHTTDKKIKKEAAVPFFFFFLNLVCPTTNHTFYVPSSFTTTAFLRTPSRVHCRNRTQCTHCHRHVESRHECLRTLPFYAFAGTLVSQCLQTFPPPTRF